jgi:tetratricopeptide (TPR) repeat protein
MVLDAYDPTPGSSTTVAQRLLEAALPVYPESIDLLRALLHCSLVMGDDRRRDEALRALEDLEPESREVSEIAAAVARGTDGPRAPKSTKYWKELSDLITGPRRTSDEGLRQAALADLCSMVQQFPCSVDLSFLYAFALLELGKLESLRFHMAHLAALERPAHATHFNLTQLLFALDDKNEAQRHLDLAIRYATSEEEMSDAEHMGERLGLR